MSINEKRAKEFADYIQQLQGDLNFELFYETFKSKLFDLISRGQIDPEKLKQAAQVIEKEFNVEMVKYIDKIHSQYNDIINATNFMYDDIGPEINRELTKLKAVEKVTINRLGDYRDTAVKEIRDIVTDSLKENKRITEIRDELRQSEDDKIVSYADTIARTQVKGYSQAGKVEKANLGDVYFYKYSGIIRKATRTFCLQLLHQSNPTFHINDINKMSNGQLKPVLIYAGGFNCHHPWEPDPFASSDDYSAKLYTIQDKNRTLTLAQR